MMCITFRGKTFFGNSYVAVIVLLMGQQGQCALPVQYELQALITEVMWLISLTVLNIE